MMNDESPDFLLDWQNIEYALNESELITLNEMDTTGKLFRVDLSGLGGLAPAGKFVVKKAGQAMMGPAFKDGKGLSGLKQGFQNIGSNLGRIARNPLFKTEFWNRLKTKLRDLWLRFRNMIAALFRSNQGFVEKELDNVVAIVKNAQTQARGVKNGWEGDILHHVKFNDLYPYWRSNSFVNNMYIPPLNINNSSMMDLLATPSDFLRIIIPGFNGMQYTNNQELAEQLKAIFRGNNGEKMTKCSGSSIMPYIEIIIDHCRDKDGVINRIKQDTDSLITAAQEAYNYINRMGVVQEAGVNNYGEFDNNVENMKAEQVLDTLTKIRNYISICQCINGVRETIVIERYNQAIYVCREILKQCSAPATKEQQQNAEMNRNITVTKESSKNEEPVKKRGKGIIGRMQARHDTKKKIMDPSKERGEIEVDEKYLNSLPSDMRKLTKRAEKVQQQRDEIINFIKRKNITQDDGRFGPLWDQVQDYEKHLAVLSKRMRDIEDKEKGEEE